MWKPISARSASVLILAATTAALIAAGCTSSGTPAPVPPATGAPGADGAVATPAVVPAQSATAIPTAAASIVPTATPVATARPERTPPVLTSAYYRYRFAFPTAEWYTTAAQQRWDGAAAIDGGGPYVDRAYGPGSELFFVFGELTTLSTAAWAAAGQKNAADWWGCPAKAETTGDTVVGGVPGRLHAFHCLGLFVRKAFVVHDGFGYVFNEIGPNGNEAHDVAAFEAFVGAAELTRP